MLVTLSHFFRLVPHVPVDDPLIDTLRRQDAGEGMAECVESRNMTPLVVFGKGSVEVIGRLALGERLFALRDGVLSTGVGVEPSPQDDHEVGMKINRSHRELLRRVPLALPDVDHSVVKIPVVDF